jgi:chitin synthase
VSAAEGQALVDSILVTVLRYMLIASFVLYFVPVFIFWLMFCRFDPFCEVMLGFPAFLFYTPTYLIILNIYSLCKMDDMSWGTKGLEAESGDANTLAKEWKLIKYIHVVKYLIWNIILAAVLVSLG